MGNKKLTVIVYFYIVVLVMISILTIGITWINSTRITAKETAEEIYDIQVNNHKTELRSTIMSLVEYIDYQRFQAEEILKNDIKSRTYEAYNIIENLYDTYKDSLSEVELKLLIVETLRDIRFNDDRGYYFIDSLEGDVILYPIAPSSEGTNLLSLQDERGNFTLQNEIDLVQSQSEGFIEGYWQKPGSISDLTYKKITYVKGFAPYNWYVGCGEYVDDVESDIQNSILEYFNGLKFGHENNQYIFVHDFEGNELANGQYSDFIGTNNYDYRDDDGVYVLQEQIKIVRSDMNGGFLEHNWLDTYDRKITYVHRIKDWNWVIGSSYSMTSIENMATIKTNNLEKETKQQIIRIVLFIILLLLIGFVFASSIVKRLKKELSSLKDMIENAADSLETIELERVAYSDFEEVVHITNHMTHKINNLMHYDHITGLRNKNFMLNELEVIRSEAYGRKKELSLLLLDINDFDMINKNHGVESGNVVLRIVGALINKVLRDGDVIGRFDEEKLLIILPNTSATIAMEIAERIKRSVEQKIIDPLKAPIVLSGGLVTDYVLSSEELINTAEVRLYKSLKVKNGEIINQ